MKKAIAVIAVVCVVCAAGSAFAGQQKNNRINQRLVAQMPQNAQKMPQPQQFQPCNPGYGCCQCYDGRGPRGMGQSAPFDNRGRDFGRDNPRGRQDFAPDMPQEVRSKVTEIAKLRIDLDEALSSRPVNKAKALDVHAQIQKLSQEVDAWRFAQRIDRMETLRTQQELNRKIPVRPAPNTEAPAPEVKAEAEVSAE